MLTPEQIRARLQDRVMTKVSKETGIHYNTLLRFRDGHTESPSYKMVARLSEYLTRQEAL